MTMRDLKLLPDRKALASAIVLHAGARRDLQVAEQAMGLASSRLWDSQSRLDELRESATPNGAHAAKFIESVGAGAPCDAAVLGRSSVDASAKIRAAENDVDVWQQTREECAQAVRAKNDAVVAAQEAVERAARKVLCHADTVSHLIDELAHVQSEVVSRRSVLRFVYSKGLNGELERGVVEQVERVLQRDMLGMEPTSASAAWGAVFDELMTNSDADLPAGVA